MEKDYKKLISYMKEIGIEANPSTFSGRIRIQKFGYIITKLIPSALQYSFGFYILGPYSPDLAKDYYRCKIEDLPSLSSVEAKKVDRIKELKTASVLELEIMASLLSIRERSSNDDEAKIRLMKIKPYLKLPDIENAALQLKKLGLMT